MSQTPLALKLKLLQTLRTGSLAETQALISQISCVTKINPELYEKFNRFITENKDGCTFVGDCSVGDGERGEGGTGGS